MGPLQTPKTAHFSPRLPLNPGNVEQGGAAAAGSHTSSPTSSVLRTQNPPPVPECGDDANNVRRERFFTESLKLVLLQRIFFPVEFENQTLLLRHTPPVSGGRNDLLACLDGHLSLLMSSHVT